MTVKILVNMGQFLNEVVGKIPNFVGIKYTCKNLEEGIQAVRANDGNFAVFLGNDQVRLYSQISFASGSIKKNMIFARY